MTTRRALPNRREHTTVKLKILGPEARTVYLTLHDDPEPAEVFIRVRGANVPDEAIALYDVLARMMSLALQHGAPLAKVGAMLEGVQASPAGPVQGDERVRFCRSVPDLIGRYLGLEAEPVPSEQIAQGIRGAGQDAGLAGDGGADPPRNLPGSPGRQEAPGSVAGRTAGAGHRGADGGPARPGHRRADAMGRG